MNKLIEYFRNDGYQEYGWYGDEFGWNPEETAIHFLKERARLGISQKPASDALSQAAPTLAALLGEAQTLIPSDESTDNWHRAVKSVNLLRELVEVQDISKTNKAFLMNAVNIASRARALLKEIGV